MQQVSILQIFLKKTDLAKLKSDVDKIDVDRLKNSPTNLSNLKSKVDKLDVYIASSCFNLKGGICSLVGIQNICV